MHTLGFPLHLYPGSVRQVDPALIKYQEVRRIETGMNAPQAMGVDWPLEIHGALKDAGISLVSYVPDAGHKRLIVGAGRAGADLDYGDFRNLANRTYLLPRFSRRLRMSTRSVFSIS